MRHVDLNTNGIINRHELNQFLFPDEEAQFQIMVCHISLYLVNC